MTIPTFLEKYYNAFVQRGFIPVEKSGPVQSLGLGVKVPKESLAALEKSDITIFFYDMPTLVVRYAGQTEDQEILFYIKGWFEHFCNWLDNDWANRN